METSSSKSVKMLGALRGLPLVVGIFSHGLWSDLVLEGERHEKVQKTDAVKRHGRERHL